MTISTQSEAIQSSVISLVSQIRRLMAERDLLLSAIRPEDYAKIREKLVAVSESPDA
jgi:hypothetical protein